LNKLADHCAKRERRERRKKRMSEQIKRVNRELKFKGKIIDFYQDTMEINGDHTVIWDFIKHKGAAAVVPVTKDGKILMVRQYRNALERYTLEIPAGALDAEEEPGIECAARELEEETGYRSEKLEWLITLRTTVAFCNEKIEVYVAKDLIPSKQHLDEDEFIDLKAYSLEELKEKIFTGEIEDAKTVASLMAYAVKYES
jgi:ADP-ribose pyrophosphatase